MRFLVDAHLPPALARWLNERGHDAEHVFDLGMRSAADRQIWEYAQSVGSIVITKDSDFANRRVLTFDGPQIVWIRSGNAPRRQLLTWLEPLFPDVLDALSRGEAVVEVV
jgi:predicted nuclease of predicted toxin-antitoxin system